MEGDRRQIARERSWDLLLARALPGLGILLAGSVPLAICWQILRVVHREKEDPIVAEVLIQELATPDSPLFPRWASFPAIPDASPVTDMPFFRVPMHAMQTHSILLWNQWPLDRAGLAGLVLQAPPKAPGGRLLFHPSPI